MLKLQFLHKNSLAFTSTYFYGFYGSKDNFDDLDPKEQDLIRRITGVDGYAKSKGKTLKTGYRDKGIEFLKNQPNVKPLIKTTVEDLYFDFLNSLSEMGYRKDFNPNYNKDHENSGENYNIDSFLNTMIKDFVSSRNSDKKNQLLYIQSFDNEKKDNGGQPGTIDLDIAKDSINIAYVSQNSMKSDWDNIINRASFKDSLLLLKFFERYFSLNSLIQYIKTHDIKKQYAEVSKHIKRGESNTKMGTLPRLNYAELDLKDGRSSFLKKIKRADANTRAALDDATIMFLTILRDEDISLVDLPEDLIHDKYIFSLRNDTFYDLRDYIKNRRAIVSGDVDIVVNGERVTSKIAEGDIFKTTIDLYKNLKRELSCSEISLLLNANASRYKEIYKEINDKHLAKARQTEDLEDNLAELNKILATLDKTITTRKQPKQARFLTDAQINLCKEHRKQLIRKKEELTSKLNSIKNKEDSNPNEFVNEKYIKYLKSFKNHYLELEEDIKVASFMLLMEDTPVSNKVFNVLSSKYNLSSIIDNQDFLTFHNKCQINSATVTLAINNNWHDLGDGWYGSPLTYHCKPTLINVQGMMYDPVDRTIRPIYFAILKKNFSILNDNNRHIFSKIEDTLREYLAFATINSDALEYYIKWRDDNNAKNRQRVQKL